MIGGVPGVQEMGLLMKFMGDASGAVGAMGKVTSAVTGTIKVVGGLSTAAVAMGVAMGGVIMKMGSAGSSTKMAREEFHKMATGMNIDGKELIETLGRIAGGTVKDTELIQQANLAMLLGGKELAKALPTLMGIAAEKARALGMPITQAFSDIVRGVGRASPLILDNLGIIVDNVGAQKELAKSLGYVKEEQDKVSASYEEHTEKLKKLEEDYAIVLIEQKELTEARRKEQEELERVNAGLDEHRTGLQELQQEQDAARNATDALRAEIEKLDIAEAEVVEQIEAHNDALWSLQDELREAQLAQRDQKDELKDAQEVERELIQEIDKHTKSLESLTVQLEKNIEKQQSLRKEIVEKQVVELDRVTEKIGLHSDRIRELTSRLEIATVAYSELTGEEKESVRLGKERQLLKLQEQLAEEMTEVWKLQEARSQLNSQLAGESQLVAEITATRALGIGGAEKELLIQTRREELEIAKQLALEQAEVEKLQKSRESLGVAEKEEAVEASQRLILKLQDAIYEERDALKHLSKEKRQIAEARREELKLVAEADEQIRELEAAIRDEEAAIKKLESAQAKLTEEEKASVIARRELKIERMVEQIDAEKAAIEELIPKLQEFGEEIKADTKRLSKEEKTLALVNAIQEKYGKTVDISGDRVLSAGEKTQSFTTMLGNLKDRLNEAAIPALEILLGIITPIGEKLVSLGEKVIAVSEIFFRAFKEEGLVAAIDAIFNALTSPMVLDNLGIKLPDALEKVVRLLKSLFDAFKDEGPMAAFRLFFEKARDIIGEVIPKIIDFIRDAVPKIVNQLVEWGRAFINWIKENDVSNKVLTKLGELATKIWDWIIETASTIGGKLVEWAGKFIDWIKENDVINKVLTKLKELGQKIWDWIIETASTIGEKLVEWAGIFIDWIVENDVINKVLTELKEFAQKIWDWIKEAVPVLVEKLGEWAKAFIDWVEKEDILNKVLTKLKDFGEGIWNWIKEVVPILLEKLGAWAHVFVDWLAEENVPGKLIEKLGEFLGKIYHWIYGTGVPMLWEAAVGLANAILNAFKGGGPEGEPSLAKKILSYLWDDFLPSVLKGIISIGAGLARGLIEGILQIFGASKEEAKEVVDEIIGWFEGLIETIGNVIDEIKAVFGWQSILGILNDFLTAIAPLMDKIMEPFKTFVGLIEKVLGIIELVIRAVAGLFGVDLPGGGGVTGDLMKVFVTNWPSAPGGGPAGLGVTIINNWPTGIGAVDRADLSDLIEAVTYRSIKRVFAT